MVSRVDKPLNPVRNIMICDNSYPVDSSILSSNVANRNLESMATGMAETKRITKILHYHEEKVYSMELENKWQHGGKDEFEARNL